MLSRFRSILESRIQSGEIGPEEKRSLEVYYGRNWLKCPRHLCFYFHEGFPDARSRDQHLSRHERPFCCSHDGCSRTQTGFSTEKLLKAHLKKSHPDPESLSWKFPKGQKNAPPSCGKVPAVYQCTLCPNRFTRAYALRSHLRTHTYERPFVCTVCDKAFARQNDRKIHEVLHSGVKNFVCSGYLKQGGQWGCGRRFARPDGLGRHFRSEAGRRSCIKPLLDEEARERQRLRQEQQQSQGITSIPEALIAQYPALVSNRSNSPARWSRFTE